MEMGKESNTNEPNKHYKRKAGIQFEHLIKDFKKAPIVVVVRRAHLFMKDIADY
jgi:hypothetical protein